VFAGSVPSLDGVGAAWTSFLPWTAVLLVLLAVAAVVRRAWWGLSTVIVAAMVWSALFVPQLVSSSVPAAPPDLVVATQNIGAANPDPIAAAQALVATGAGLVAVQEMVDSSGAPRALDASYGFQASVGTVGLWSQWPMDEPEPLELGLSWARALRVVVHHTSGDITVYAVHLPSVRPGNTSARDRAVAELADMVQNDPAGRVLVVGDLNTAGTDPVLDPLTDELADSRETVKGGFGFTWPAQFPLTRPDHVLTRGVDAMSDQVLAATGSDHRAVVVGLRFGS
jgi:vancomycin resistance protein VanJ